ncbi:MAG: hypothetical protein ACM3ZB_05405 [bacterium]|jgi:hypothetical protein
MAARTVEPQRLTDVWGWALTALLTLVSLSLPGLLQLASEPGISLVVTASALFFSGVLMGCLRPVRIWRWPLASIIGFFIWGVYRAAASPTFTFSSEPASVVSSLASDPQNWLYALPVLLGAFAGSSLIHAGAE